MTPQIQFFKNAIEDFASYSALIRAGAIALQNNDRSSDLVVSLMRDNNDALPGDIIDRLLNGAAKVDEAPVNIRAALARADVTGAQQLIRSHTRSLDRILEPALDMQSPVEARIPPPYRYFRLTIEQMDKVFPFELDDPLETPEVRAFQQHLQTVENPWRTR